MTKMLIHLFPITKGYTFHLWFIIQKKAIKTKNAPGVIPAHLNRLELSD